MGKMNFMGWGVMWGDRDTNFEAIAIIQARDNDGLDDGSNSGHDEMLLNLEYILQIEVMRPTDALNVACKEKRGFKDDS